MDPPSNYLGRNIGGPHEKLQYEGGQSMVGTNELDGLCSGDLLDSDDRELEAGQARAVLSNVNEASKIGKAVVHLTDERVVDSNVQRLEVP